MTLYQFVGSCMGVEMVCNIRGSFNIIKNNVGKTVASRGSNRLWDRDTKDCPECIQVAFDAFKYDDYSDESIVASLTFDKRLGNLPDTIMQSILDLDIRDHQTVYKGQ